MRDRFDLRLDFIFSLLVAISPSQMADFLADVGQFIERRRLKQEFRDTLPVGLADRGGGFDFYALRLAPAGDDEIDYNLILVAIVP